MKPGKYDFRQFDQEAWLIKRLGEHGRRVQDGLTDPEERRERIRFAILEGKLDCAIIGKNTAGKTETYAQAFQRFYGEPLEPRQPKGKTHAHA